MGEELCPVRGADGLAEEALLTQQLLDGIVLPHGVLLYDLGKGPLVSSPTEGRSDHSGDSNWHRYQGTEQPKENIASKTVLLELSGLSHLIVMENIPSVKLAVIVYLVAGKNFN